MIKILEIDTSGKVPFPEAHNPMLEKIRGLKKIGGVSLKGEFPEITLIIYDGFEVPSGLVDYFTCGLLNVISTKLKNILECLNAELEYFPVRVIYKDSPTELDYFVANPLIRINAVDLSQSDIELEEEFPIAISAKNLVIDEGKFAGINLAVIGELQMIGVQSEVAYAIEQSGCTGCVFVNPDTIKF